LKDSNELGVESIGKLLLKFSIPAVIGMLVNVLYSIVDRIFVGKYVGELQLSGVAVTFPITNVIMAFAMLAGIGAGSVVSIKLGQNKKAEAEQVLGNAFTLLILFSVVLTILGLIFINPILTVLGASPAVMTYSKQFAIIIVGGLSFQTISLGLNALIRAEGNPRTAMLTMLIGALLNLVINPTLIFVFHLGVRGSAFSTVISLFVASSWTLLYYFRGKSMLKIRRENLRLKKHVVKEIISIGMSPFVMQLAASLVTVTFNLTLKKYGGDLAIGAMAIVTSISMLILMPIFGIVQGAQPIIGYNYGAKNFHRVKKAFKYATLAATAVTTIGFIFVEVLPTQIIKVFNNGDVDAINMGAHGLRIFLIFLPLIGFGVVGANLFQAIAKAKTAMILSLLRQVILLIPMIIILPYFFQITGVWMAQAVSDLLSTLITIYVVAKELKRMNNFSTNTTDEVIEENTSLA
jgi:putative MATE family efflux protein